MLRTLKTIHVNRVNEILRLLHIVPTNGPTPIRPRIVPVRLQQPLFPLQVTAHRPADVAHGNRERPFPRGALGAWVAPSVADGGLSTLGGRIGAVVVSGYVVGVEGGGDYVLDLDAGVVGAVFADLVGAWGRGDPAPLMGGRRDYVIFLPV